MVVFVCLISGFTSHSITMVMSRLSVNLTTLFLGRLLNRGEYRFTVYIENRYLWIDIWIESHMFISKEISITHVSGQNIYLNRKSIHKFKNCENSLLIPTKMHNLLPISLFWSCELSYYVIGLLYWQSMFGGRTNIGSAKVDVSDFFVLITRFAVLPCHRSSYWRSIFGQRTTIASAKFG